MPARERQEHICVAVLTNRELQMQTERVVGEGGGASARAWQRCLWRRQAIEYGFQLALGDSPSPSWRVSGLRAVGRVPQREGEEEKLHRRQRRAPAKCCAKRETDEVQTAREELPGIPCQDPGMERILPSFSRPATHRAS